MTLVTWMVIFGLATLFAIGATRVARQAMPEESHDTGLAILQFGRAFPNEAIRSLHATADGKAVFVRLHDNRAGLMRNMRSHFACHLIEPGTVRVRDLPNGRGLSIEFLDAPFHNGDFTFTSATEAAEVSLWLLGNYVSPSDRPEAAEPLAKA